MPAWKVVKVDNLGYVSAVASAAAQIRYIIDEVAIVPEFLKRSGLYPLVFSDVNSAISFAITLSDNRAVLLCDVADPNYEPGRFDVYELGRKRMLRTSRPFPTGTVSFKTVIPRKAYSIADFMVQQGWQRGYICCMPERIKRGWVELIQEEDYPHGYGRDVIKSVIVDIDSSFKINNTIPNSDLSFAEVIYKDHAMIFF